MYRSGEGSEAEWEFAAKGGTKAQTPTPYIYGGSNTEGDVAWYYSNSGHATHTVGQKTANELGLYDMSGNAYEWCWDWYSSTYPNGGPTAPQGPTSAQSSRILRGGSFAGDYSCSSVWRNDVDGPNYTSYDYGFRCVQH